MKKITTMIAIGASALLFTACGGGGTDNSNNSGSTPTTPSESTAGKAFYIDGAVSGVKYQCGDKEGTTGNDGSFNFEEGKDCTFYLGDIMLRDIASDDLKEGKKIYETDIKIARVLQSLDTDYNLTNGITINNDIIKKMQNAGLTIAKLPTTDSEIDDLVKNIAKNGGAYVSSADAQNHLALNNPNLYSFGNIGVNTWDPSYKFNIKYTYDANGNRLTMKAVSNNCRDMEIVKSTYTYENNKVTEKFTIKSGYGSETGTIIYDFKDTIVQSANSSMNDNEGTNHTTIQYEYYTPGKIKTITGNTDGDGKFIIYLDEQGLVVNDTTINDDGSKHIEKYEYYSNGILKKYIYSFVKTDGTENSHQEEFYDKQGNKLDQNGNPITC